MALGSDRTSRSTATILAGGYCGSYVVTTPPTTKLGNDNTNLTLAPTSTRNHQQAKLQLRMSNHGELLAGEASRHPE